MDVTACPPVTPQYLHDDAIYDDIIIPKRFSQKVEGAVKKELRVYMRRLERFQILKVKHDGALKKNWIKFRTQIG